MPPRAVARPCRTTTYAALLAGAGALAFAAPAAAQTGAGTGGTAPVAPAPAAGAPAGPPSPSPTADLYGRPAPRLSGLRCAEDCAAGGGARPGSLMRIGGKGLRKITEVIFFGADGDADDASVAPRSTGRRSLTARVPRTAVSGLVGVARSDGTRSVAFKRPLEIAPEPVDVPAGVIDAEVQGTKVFFGSHRPAELSYVVGGDKPVDVQIDLVRASDSATVAHWEPGSVAPETPQEVRWNGMADGKPARDGIYQFRVTATDPSGLRAMSAQASAPGPVDEDSPGAFTLLGYRFPILGAHKYGTGAAAFGGGRGHQGQDVFAACGTPLVAARGGVVQFKQYHARAGYYIVIDGARTGTDYAYMHLKEAALVGTGDKVKTGQLIGYVGDTGHADGCHLHFEEWTAPGWYSGGSAFNPLPDLQAWDAAS